jgi:hypothetical protein
VETYKEKNIEKHVLPIMNHIINRIQVDKFRVTIK